MNRSTKEIKLPISKGIAECYTWFTRGEKVAIKDALFDGGQGEFVNGDFVIKGVKTDCLSKQDYMRFKFGVHKLKDSDGNELPVTKETYDNLPDVDISEILSLLEIVNTGEIEPVSKKK
jgi:hypothetical protein